MGEIFCAGTLLWVQAFFKSVSTDGFESFERKSSRIAGWTCWPLRSAFLNDNSDDSDSDDGDDGDDAYMQKTCDVAGKAILAKKEFAEKVRKSRQNVNRDKSA